MSEGWSGTLSHPLSHPLGGGEVALVGAGPGAADLLAMAAAKLIVNCDALVFDALISGEVLNLAAAAKGELSVTSPAIVIVGDVVAGRVAWRGDK